MRNHESSAIFVFPGMSVNIDEQSQKNNPGYKTCICGYCNKIKINPLVLTV